MTYGIIFWVSSHLSNNIFKIQKRIIRMQKWFLPTII
jgi:hypothetical protein